MLYQVDLRQLAMKDNKKEIRRINKDIKGALNFWADMLLISDADQWSYQLNYDDKDLLNALYIFNHVAQNKAIKSGHLTEDNVELRIRRFCDCIENCFGFNTIELTNKVLNCNGTK